MAAEQEQLVHVTQLTYDQLRRAAESLPDDKLDWSPAAGAMGPRMQIIHACAADRGYGNRIDNGERRTELNLERELTTRRELIAHLEETREMTVQLIRALAPSDMDKAVDISWFPGATVRFVLLHMLRHKHYHVGQLNLMRWMLGVGP